MKEKAIGKVIGGLLICLMLGLVFGGLIDTTSATTEKTTVSVTESSPWFTKGSNSGSGPWYPHTYDGHSYISTYVGGMSGNPSQPDCWAEFKPYLSQSGKYEVYAHFYACKDTSTKVPFSVKYDGGSTTIKVNQYRSSPAWKEKYLGTWDFKAGADTYVKVTDATGETYNGITGLSVGTIKFVKVQTTTVSSPPRNLRVTEVGSGYVKIAWDTPSSDGGSSITNYKIYRGASSGAETLYYTTSTAGTAFRNTANLVDGVTYYYKVTAVNSVGESDFSNEAYATYHPAGTITLTSPNGGEHWPIGRNREIRWTSSDVTENVRIDLSRNGGSSWETIFSNTANDGSEWWTVTGTATTQARVRVVSLQNTAISAMSDANFKIFSITATVTSPRSGTNWPAGSTQTITWSMRGDTSNLDYFWVAYSMNGGQSWTNINTATASARSLNWAIPSDLSSTQCKIRVRALDADGWILTEGVSDVFTIHQTPSENTISFYTNPSSVGSITFSDTTYYTHGQSGKYSSGTYSISPNVPSGYKFKSWSTSGEVSVASSTSSSTTVTINGDCSLTANFESLPSTTVNGIDVSHWQGDIDWSQVYNSGYKFAFAKATGGTGFIDGDFEGNMIEGHNAGMLMGAYHFAYPEYNDPVDEAQFFVSVAGEYLREGYLRPVLDIEDDQNENSYPCRLGKEALSNWIHEFMSTVESETGVQPIIYVNKNYTKKDHLDTSINQYQLWIAHWTCDTNMPPDTGDTGIWNNWDFWQYWEPEYCGENSIPGITSGVDLDVFNGDMSRLNTFMIIVSNKPPTCAIELQKEVILINEVNVGHFFDIYVGDSTGDIKQVRFSSDDSQDGVPEGEWTEWYDWSISSEDWNAISKTKAWKFTTEGSKEVWAEVKDGDGQTDKAYTNIIANPEIPTPLISGFDPSRPIACSGKQWITIIGNGFVSDSEVSLSVGLDTYLIPEGRTWFINSNKIEVLVGLTKGTWKVWITNPDDIQSNKYTFQVSDFSIEDGKKVAALALPFWKDEENVTTMVAIAAAESCWNPNVGGDYGISNFNCGGYASWGLWQIYMDVHKDKLKKLGAPIDDPCETAKWLSDPNNNVKAAYEVWKVPGFKAWSTYNNGKYKAYLDYARDAVKSLAYYVHPIILVDSDGDGLTDEEELKYGTNPNKQDSDDDGFSDKLEVDLALEYKPILALSDGELFYPTKVENFLNHSRLMKKPDKRMEGPPVSPESLEIYSTTEYYLDLAFGPDSDATGLDHAIGLWEEMLHANVTYTSVSKANIPYICMGKAEQYELISVQYWFFYIYNYHPQFPDHEGDWEHITVYLDNRSMKPVVVIYNRHHLSPELVKWNDLKRKVGNHPIVFVANGSHASYPDCGQMIIGGGYKSEKQILDSHWGEGPWINIQNLNVIMLQTQPWIYFKGKWGENSPWSPDGLMHTKYFRDPALELQEAGFDLTEVYS